MKSLITMLVLVFTFSLQAQPNPENSLKIGTITGKVLDAQLNEPLPYVTVVVKDKADKTITGGITNDDGTFTIENIDQGEYNVSVQFVGYKTVTKPIIISRKNKKVDLGIIKLEEDITSLDEVTVVAETSTIQQKVDRKVITIGKDLVTSGATASDIMNNLPSVNLDQQTGSISMRGNQNVRVMVDGKLSNIPADQLLKQIPTASIKSIELITNPSAKYNPEGMSGIINIVLHKNTKIGFNGNINLGLSHERTPKFNSSIDMNYRNGKFNFYGNYGNSVSRNLNYGNISRTEQDISQRFNILNNNKSHLFKVGVDFYLDDKNTISFFTNQNIYNGYSDVDSGINYSNAALNSSQITEGDDENDSQQYNFNYKLDIAEGHNIELEVDHNLFDGDNNVNNTFFNSGRPNFFENRGTDRERTTINLDYVNPLSETTKLELGLQARLFNTNIDYNSNAREQNIDGDYIPTATNFDYTRNIYSAYATYGGKINKITYQLGLRAETVNVESDALRTDLSTNEETAIPFDNDYFEIYPSAFFTYAPSEKNSYQLSYSRRIDRPGIGQVNPLPQWNTPLISQFGNQQLRPQFTNSIEANYTRNLEKGSITAGVFYRLIEDEIQQAALIDRTDTNRLILTNLNFDNTSAYGIELSSNYRPTKWWSLNGSFDLYSQTQTSIAESFNDNNDIVLNEVEVDNVAYNVRVFNNFKASKSLSFSAFAMYRGKQKGIQFNMDPMFMLNLGMRYTFLERKATFSFSYNDILNTMYARFEGDRPIPQRGQFNWESNTWNVNLSYRFGGGKYRAKSRKRRDNDEKSGGGFM